MFSCAQWATKSPAATVCYCIFDKSLLLIDLAVIALTVYQLWVYLSVHKIKIDQDFRIWVLGTSLIGLINTFLHYGVLPATWKARSFVLIEVFRNGIFFMICYYYCTKAGSLLSNRVKCLSGLRAMFLLILAVSMILAIDIWVHTVKYENGDKSALNPLNLCSSIEFQIFRWTPHAMCAVFQYAFWDIQNKVFAKPIVTDLDRKIFELQDRTLDKLRKVIIVFCSASWFLIL